MALWQVRHKTHSGHTLHTIRPESLHFERNLNDAHTITYQISLDNPVIKESNTAEGDPFGSYQTDWYLLRDGVQVKAMAGQITSLSIPQGQEYVEVNGQSWLHYLDRRHFPFDALNPKPNLLRAFETDVTDIIHSMISAVIARPYSLDIDLTDLVGRTTFKTNLLISFQDTETILSKLKTLAEGKPGFDFAINADKKFFFYYPEFSDPTDTAWHLTVDKPKTLKTSSSMEDLSWTDNGPNGTHIAATGAGLANQLAATRGSTDGQQTFRRMDFSADFGDVANRVQLNRLADGALRAAVRPQREVPIKVIPEDIPDFYNKFHEGNYFIAEANLDAHQVGGTKKITKVTVDVTNEGEELAEISSTLWRAWYSVDSAEDQV